MRILIDLQPCQSESRFRGIGRYSLSLALAIARNADTHEVWLLLNDRFPESVPAIRQTFASLIPPQQIVVFSIPADTSERHAHRLCLTKASEKIRAFFIATLNPDVVHVSSLFEGWADDVVTSIGSLPKLNQPTSVTLYDLIPLINPDVYLANKQLESYYFRKVEALKKSDWLLAISESSRYEVIDQLGIDKTKVTNISAAADRAFQPIQLTDTACQKLFWQYGITRPFLMYAPGGFDQRKNIQRLIQAYASLSESMRRQHQLVITGKLPPEMKPGILQWMETQGLKPHELVLTDYVSDSDLVALYNLCKLFIFPSVHEGFGLPALEAMSCGAASIGSDISSIPEIINRKDALFDPYSVEAIAQAINCGLSDRSFRESLKQDALVQSAKFSWDSSANLAIAAFEDLYAQSKQAQSEQAQTYLFKTNLGQSHNKASFASNSVAFDASNTLGPSALAELSLYDQLISELSTITDLDKQSNAELRELATSIGTNLSFQTRRLLVDISQLVILDAKSGIQRVVRSILINLLQNPPNRYQIVPIYWDGAQYRRSNKFIADLLPHLSDTTAEKAVDTIIDIACNDIFLGLDLTAHLAVNTKETLERFRRLGVEIYFVVYDILLIHHSEWWPKEFGTTFQRWLEIISELSTGLICISQATADAVKDWLLYFPPQRVDYLKICHFHLGADIDQSLPSGGLPEDAATVVDALKTTPTILMVATVEPRKGHTQALKAFDLLWQSGLNVNLVLVGKHGWQVDQLVQALDSHPERDKQLFWLQGISDEYLDKVYSVSTALLAASEGEGFGLPLIEAAQHRLPIIARGLPVFREVAGDHAFYFEGSEPEQLAAAIKTWLSLHQSGEAPSSEAMPWLTWTESTQQMLKAIMPEH